MKMNRELIISCIVLVCLTIFTVYKFLKLDNEFYKHKREAFLDDYVAESLRNTNRIILNGTPIIKKLLKQHKPEYSKINTNSSDASLLGVIFFVRANDCPSCITDSWEMVDKFYNVDSLLHIQPIVFFEETKATNLDSYFLGVEFEMDIINTSYIDLLDSINVKWTPQLIIYNYSNGTILDAYQPEPNNLVTRDAFHSVWKRILNSRGAEL